MKKIAVLGAGGWGTALACLLHDNGHHVSIWFRSEGKAKQVQQTRKQVEYLPDVTIPEGIRITHVPEEAVADADVIVISISSKGIRELLQQFRPHLKPNQLIVNTSKGLEAETLLTLSAVIEDVLPMCRVSVLSGPTHAEEVCKRIPTAVVASAKEMAVAEEVQAIFMNTFFRVYTNTDIIGVELGAALKNVIALAAGISDGMGFGDNSKAALMTRGIVEMARLGVALGANRDTFHGLSGIGDLIVTCTSMHSRNRRTGILLGQGKSLAEALEEVHMVVEGVNAAKAAYDLSLKYNVDMPLTTGIYKTLFQNESPKELVYALMNRDEKSEIV